MGTRSVSAREFSDLRIVRLSLKNMWQTNEKVIADHGYADVRCSRQVFYEGFLSFSNILAIHEATNKRLKQFKVLGGCFRQSLHLDAQCFSLSRT